LVKILSVSYILMADQDPQKPIVIWLDGTFAEYESNVLPPTQQKFQNEITAPPSLPLSSEAISHLICGDNHPDRITVGKVVEIASTPDDAYRLIEKYRDRKIYFVSSGSLGSTAIPYIGTHYYNVLSFYVFCHSKASHVNWAFPYRHYLRMFTHPIDLLVRLMRDISVHFISFGKSTLTVPNTHSNIPLRYFRHAEYLENKANELDYIDPQTMPPNYRTFDRPPRQTYLNQLQGNNGLISQAEAIANPQQNYDNNAMDTQP